ncbi:MAG TPA: hypothetical protein VGG06_18785 [Thermoanaerobaculia bacterium]
MNLSRLPTMKPYTEAQRVIAAGALPETLKRKLQVDLRDAIRRGFHVDVEELRRTLARRCGA